MLMTSVPSSSRPSGAILRLILGRFSAGSKPEIGVVIVQQGLNIPCIDSYGHTETGIFFFFLKYGQVGTPPLL